MSSAKVAVLNHRRVCIVGFSGELEKKLRCELDLHGCLVESYRAPADVKTPEVYDFVLIDSHSDISSGLAGLRAYHPETPSETFYFILVDRFDEKVSAAFFEGAQAVFPRNVPVHELALSMALAGVSEYNRPSGPRFGIRRARVSYTFDGETTEGYATNISGGGMFVGAMQRLPARGQKIEFSIELEGKFKYTGQAIVRWIRLSPKSGKSPGFGVEFLETNPIPLDLIQAYRAS